MDAMHNHIKFRDCVVDALELLAPLLDEDESARLIDSAHEVRASVTPAVLALGWAHAVRGSIICASRLQRSVKYSRVLRELTAFLWQAINCHGNPEALSNLLDELLDTPDSAQVPAFPECWYDAASALALMFEPGQSTAGLGWLRRTVVQKGLVADVLLFPAWMFLCASRPEDALVAADLGLSLLPDDALLLLAKANALNGLDLWQNALDIAEQGIALAPEESALLLAKANALIRLLRYQGALDTGIALEPNDTALLIAEANALSDLDRHHEALNTAERGLALAPEAPQLMLAKADALNNLNRYQEALDTTERAIELAPLFEANADAMFLDRYQEALDTAKVNVLKGQDLMMEALDTRASSSFAPDDRRLLCIKATALTGLGRYHEALDTAEQGLALWPDNIHLLFAKVSALGLLRRGQEALGTAEQGLALEPNFIGLLLDKAYALNDLGRSQEALDTAEKGLALAPEARGFRHAKAHALNHLGRYQEALDTAEQGLALWPDNMGLLLRKADALDRLGRTQEALDTAKLGTHVEPSEVSCHLLVLHLSQRLVAISRLQPADSLAALRNGYQHLRSASSSWWTVTQQLADNENHFFGTVDAIHASAPEARSDTAAFFQAWLPRLRNEALAATRESPGTITMAQKFASCLVGFVTGSADTFPPLVEVAREYLTFLDEVASSAPHLIEDRASFLIALDLARMHLLGLEEEAPGIRVQHLEEFVEARNGQRATLPSAIKPTLMAFLDLAAATHMALASQPDALAAAEQCSNLVHRTFELLRALELRWAAEHRHSAAFRKPDGGLATFDSAFEDLGCVRARLSKDQVLVRVQWSLNTGSLKPSLVLQLVRPQHPVVTRRFVCDPDLGAKVLRFDGLQLALWTASRSGNDAVRAVLLEHGLYEGKDPATAPLEILNAWTADVLGHLGQQVFGDVLSVADLRDKHLLLSPPAECMALPWLAVTLPCGTRLLEVVKSLQLVPVVSPAVDAAPPGPSRPGKVIICSPFEGTWYRTNLPQLCRSCDFDPEAWREADAVNPCIEAVFDEVARRTIAHLIAHLGWPDPEPLSNGLDCHPLVEMLSHRRLDTERLILELCNSGRAVGLPEGENFQSLAIACLAAGVKEVLATSYPVTPTHQDRATYRAGLYQALSEGHSLAEANVLATRHLWDSPALDPLGRALPSIWSPMLLVTAGVR